jgi:hypothetical protein
VTGPSDHPPFRFGCLLFALAPSALRRNGDADLPEEEVQFVSGVFNGLPPECRQSVRQWFHSAAGWNQLQDGGSIAGEGEVNRDEILNALRRPSRSGKVFKLIRNLNRRISNKTFESLFMRILCA